LNTQNWLTLMEYSAKYRVSLSTLRRRIKAGEVEHKFIEGKYLLKNGPPLVGQASAETIAPPTPVTSQPQVDQKKEVPNDQFWQTTQALLNEIKKAYSLILQEKEEQILQLKEEVADLKTLVRVLEDENARVKNSQPSLSDFDLGLEA
jgi:hypothetical protein